MQDRDTLRVHVPGKLSDSQLNEVQKRRNEIISRIVEKLSPRRDELFWGRKLHICDLGRCAGLLQAVVELQALIEVNERGLEARGQILAELDRPPFKHFPMPEGWGSPFADYIRQCLFSSEGYPKLQWPLNGGSEPGI